MKNKVWESFSLFILHGTCWTYQWIILLWRLGYPYFLISRFLLTGWVRVEDTIYYPKVLIRKLSKDWGRISYPKVLIHNLVKVKGAIAIPKFLFTIWVRVESTYLNSKFHTSFMSPHEIRISFNHFLSCHHPHKSCSNLPNSCNYRAKEGKGCPKIWQ